jgi:hypothetical protein
MDIYSPNRKVNETYMFVYQPAGAQPNSPEAEGYTLFDFNPSYPNVSCLYTAGIFVEYGPFPVSWYSGETFEMGEWFDLASDMQYAGQAYIPDLQKEADVWQSATICDLWRSGIGKVPCRSIYLDVKTQLPLQTIRAQEGNDFLMDEYTLTYYTEMIAEPPNEHSFVLPTEWTSVCNNANNGYTVEPVRGFVATLSGNDNFTIALMTPPVESLGPVRVSFVPHPNFFYNCSTCVTLIPTEELVFTVDNWNQPIEVIVAFQKYGCSAYTVVGSGGGYQFMYQSPYSFVVYTCDGTAGYGCDGDPDSLCGHG